MQQRPTRGIQYEDVAQAADALLQQGTRPTIERIRLHIGRGSPNTVSPMLEQWFSSLGRRLEKLDAPGQGDTDIPDAVLQTAKALWEKAFSEAQTRSELAFAAEDARLKEEAHQLLQARAQLERQEHAVNERLKTMEDALHLCTRQLEESNMRWQISQRSLAAQTAEIAANHIAMALGRKEAAALQHRLDSALSQAKQEQAALEERHRQSEHRWLAEVDRARQEARKSTLLVQETENKLASQQQQARTFNEANDAHKLDQALQISVLRHELASALRSAEKTQLLLERAQERQQPERHPTFFKPLSVKRRPVPLQRKLGKNRF